MPRQIVTHVETLASAPWAGIGQNVSGAMTSKEAIVRGGLDWTVAAQPIFVEGDFDLTTGQAKMSIVDGQRAIVRSTDKRVLGVVGDRYEIIQNDTCFDFFDVIAGAGAAMFDTVGALDKGKKVFLLARMPDYITVPSLLRGKSDIVEKYLLLSNSHDGSGSLRMFFTPIRVSCLNTLNMALSKGAGEGISIRHTSSAEKKIEEAKHALQVAQSYYKAFEVEANKLVAAKFTEGQMKELTEALFPSQKEGEELPTRTANNREALLNLFENGKGQEMCKGTAWAAYNAITEFADHHRSTRTNEDNSAQEARLQSNWFGSGRQLKDKGLTAIHKMLEMA